MSGMLPAHVTYFLSSLLVGAHFLFFSISLPVHVFLVHIRVLEGRTSSTKLFLSALAAGDTLGQQSLCPKTGAPAPGWGVCVEIVVVGRFVQQRGKARFVKCARTHTHTGQLVAMGLLPKTKHLQGLFGPDPKPTQVTVFIFQGKAPPTVLLLSVLVSVVYLVTRCITHENVRAVSIAANPHGAALMGNKEGVVQARKKAFKSFDSALFSPSRTVPNEWLWCLTLVSHSLLLSACRLFTARVPAGTTHPCLGSQRSPSQTLADPCSS